jgi:hypothetical protein
MSLLSRWIGRWVAVLGMVVAAAAMVGGLSGAASAAPTTPQAAATTTYTETTLNLGLRLTVSNANTIIAAPKLTGDFGQRWVETYHYVTVNGVGKGGWDLRPSANTTNCITDMGANQRVKLQPCNGSAIQVWQWIFGRTVNGVDYRFWINAQTGRKLMFDTATNEGTTYAFTVIASTNSYNPGTAGEACQLWTD